MHITRFDSELASLAVTSTLVAKGLSGFGVIRIRTLGISLSRQTNALNELGFYGFFAKERVPILLIDPIS